jgi:two-component system chemotaxis sensor kinase CheA
MQIDLEHFRETFFQQAGEQVGRMEAGLLALAAGDVNRGLLNAVFRGAQCIKGAAGTFGLVDIAEFTHAMESLLDGMRSGEVEPEKNRINLLLEGVDVLEALLASARHGSPAPSSSIGLRQRLTAAQGMDAFGASAAVPGKPTGPVWRIRFQPSPKVFLQGMDPLLVLRELGRLGTILDNHLDLAGVADLSALDPERCGLAWNLRLETTASESEVRDVFAFVEEGARIELEREGGPRTPVVLKQTSGARALAGRDSGTIGMATGKVDRLIDLVGELVIAQSMAAQKLHGFAMGRPAGVDGRVRRNGAAYAPIAGGHHGRAHAADGRRLPPHPAAGARSGSLDGKIDTAEDFRVDDANVADTAGTAHRRIDAR